MKKWKDWKCRVCNRCAEYVYQLKKKRYTNELGEKEGLRRCAALITRFENRSIKYCSDKCSDEYHKSKKRYKTSQKLQHGDCYCQHCAKQVNKYWLINPNHRYNQLKLCTNCYQNKQQIHFASPLFNANMDS